MRNFLSKLVTTITERGDWGFVESQADAIVFKMNVSGKNSVANQLLWLVTQSQEIPL